MAIKYRLLCLLINVLVVLPVKSNDCFKMMKKGSVISSMEINRTFNSEATINPFDQKCIINGLSVKGKVRILRENYLVRVILRDSEGGEHLVMESYDEINDADTFTFDDYCEETVFLNDIKPDSIIIIVNNAELTIDKISYACSEVSQQNSKRLSDAKKMREDQVKCIIDKINHYNNKHNKLWLAGENALTTMPYSIKKRIMGISDRESTRGIDYYVAGIFEIGTAEELSAHAMRNDSTSSPYIDHIDWRDRFGRNWMTSVKDQDTTGYCFAFASIGCAEALVNLYYNQNVDLDLSEQELAICSWTLYSPVWPQLDPFYFGGVPARAARYLSEYGVCDEIAYPFVNAPGQVCESDIRTPNQWVRFNHYSAVDSTYEDSVKSALIHHGPLISGYKSEIGGHSMVLVGYDVVKAREYLFTYGENGLIYEKIIDEDDSRCGMTCWTFKNSWGNAWYKFPYMKILFYSNSYMATPHILHYPLETSGLNNVSVVCEDNDNDGFYFWGLGPKPASCPSWVPDIPDGDDHDNRYGPINEYGFLEELNGETQSIIEITDSVVYGSPKNVYKQVYIRSGGHLTISNTTTMLGNAKITVENNGKLTINGGFLENANLSFESGSSLSIKNEGIIHMQSNKTFTSPIGVTVNISSGIIE